MSAGSDPHNLHGIDIRVVDDAGHLDDGLDAAIRRTLAICYPHHREMFSRTRHWQGHIAAYRVIAVDADGSVDSPAADGSAAPPTVATDTLSTTTPADMPAITTPAGTPAVTPPADMPAVTTPADALIVAAHVAVVDRTIRVGDTAIRVAGVAQVAALPPYRKTGLIDRVLARTIDEATQRGFDMGLLFCREPVRRVYERNGWIDITDRPCIRIETGSPVEAGSPIEADRPIEVGGHIEAGSPITMPPDNLRMVYPLRLAALPPGPIHLGCDKW